MTDLTKILVLLFNSIDIYKMPNAVKQNIWVKLIIGFVVQNSSIVFHIRYCVVCAAITTHLVHLFYLFI